MQRHTLRLLGPTILAMVAVVTSVTSASAHARPQTSSPPPNARLDAAPAHIAIAYDSGIDARGSSIVLVDGAGNVVATEPDSAADNKNASVHPVSELAPGPYTVTWTSLSTEDGDTAQGFYTFVVNGGLAGIVTSQAQSQAPAADLIATLTLMPEADNASVLRVDLNNTSAVERVRIRLSRPDLGEDLLDTRPSGDGGWVLAGNEVAMPGNWHAQVVVRRTNIFDDAQAGFDFTIDPVSGAPAFSQ